MPTPPYVHEIERSYNFLSNLNVYLLIAAGIIAISIAVVALFATRKGSELKEAQKEELAIKLKEKDLEIEEAKAFAKSADERTRLIEKNNIELKTNLEKEYIERLKLEAMVSPRRLTVAMQKQIAMSIDSFRGKKVLVQSYALDVESAVLGTQLVKIFETANIVVISNLLSQSSLGSVGLGVRVTGKNKALEESLFNSLSSIGKLAVSKEPIPRGTGIYNGFNRESEMDAVIFVGAKPISQ